MVKLDMSHEAGKPVKVWKEKTWLRKIRRFHIPGLYSYIKSSAKWATFNTLLAKFTRLKSVKMLTFFNFVDMVPFSYLHQKLAPFHVLHQFQIKVDAKLWQGRKAIKIILFRRVIQIKTIITL